MAFTHERHVNLSISAVPVNPSPIRQSVREPLLHAGIDAEAVVEAAGKALSETALEKVMVSKQTLSQIGVADNTETQWQELWPKTSQTQRH